MPNVFEYTDFREYLKDYFEESKKGNPNFSHRWLSQKIGLSTPNLIMLVMQGKRNLTQTVCFKLCEALGFSRTEADYFGHMVSFMQAKTHDEKNLHFTQMTELRRNLKTAKIEEKQYEYYSNWYNPVVRELVTYPDFDGEPKWIAKRLSPPITPQQAQRSIDLLLELGLIKKKGKRYIQADPLISTGPAVNSLAVVNFHRKTACLASESFDRHTKKERTITSCTINISEERFEELKREITDLRKKALALAEDAGKSTRVYQLNLQLFPVSAPPQQEKNR
jgi:uncharacterized protein (TIGR02147 family)